MLLLILTINAVIIKINSISIFDHKCSWSVSSWGDPRASHVATLLPAHWFQLDAAVRPANAKRM